uniref:Uncharacterized protein n=1 Tax=Oryzias melastigma TaxID=30732 RepID=A0A3B3BFW7_ORYME
SYTLKKTHSKNTVLTIFVLKTISYCTCEQKFHSHHILNNSPPPKNDMTEEESKKKSVIELKKYLTHGSKCSNVFLKIRVIGFS